MDREERIENYYQQSAWDLAERIVDLEDEVEKLKELDPSRLESALRMYVSELSHDIHSRTQNCPGCGLDHYPEEVQFFLRCWETAT